MATVQSMHRKRDTHQNNERNAERERMREHRNVSGKFS